MQIKYRKKKLRALLSLKTSSVVRSISDHANENTVIDYDVFETLAANQSASLVLQMMEKM